MTCGKELRRCVTNYNDIKLVIEVLLVRIIAANIPLPYTGQVFSYTFVASGCGSDVRTGSWRYIKSLSWASCSYTCAAAMETEISAAVWALVAREGLQL